MRHLPSVGLIGVIVFVASGAPIYADDVSKRIQVEMVGLAVAEGRSLLAIDLLEGLASQADGWREGYYRGWILELQGRNEMARAQFERLFAAAAGESLEPQWLYLHLVEQIASMRLQERLAEDSTKLDDLLSRHYEARCGLERLQGLDDLVATGRLIVNETEVPLRMARKKPRYYRLDLFLPAGPQITATDGQLVWRIAPGQDGLEGKYLSGAEAEPLLDGSWFDDVLVRYRESGERLFVARGSSGSHDAHRIEIESTDGGRQTVILDADSLLEQLRLIWGDDRQQPAVTVTTEQGEFEDCYLPARQIVETDSGTVEYTMEDYRFGQPITTAVFDRERVLEQLQSAAGEAEEE